MNVKYNVVERANPSNREAPKKFYPSIVSSGRMTSRELAAEAANVSTLSSADLAAALEIFLNIIPKELAKGNIVELGDFGSFWLMNHEPDFYSLRGIRPGNKALCRRHSRHPWHAYPQRATLDELHQNLKEVLSLCLEEI
jgi:hypothetical protein